MDKNTGKLSLGSGYYKQPRRPSYELLSYLMITLYLSFGSSKIACDACGFEVVKA